MPLDQGSEGHGRPGLPTPLCLPAGSTEAGRNALLATEMKALCEQAAEWALHVADKPERRATGIQTGWLELPALHLPPVGLLHPRISLWFARPGALSCCQEKPSHRHGGYQRESRARVEARLLPRPPLILPFSAIGQLASAALRAFSLMNKNGDKLILLSSTWSA